uniref:Probable membrane transporter protein n=1 Tax=Magnetococcus massalia (strain MO-1) TaxID=451514 RepID=A0A1S7LK17_MAGMO|nr:conserved membrane protein of unknown function [Candidatus Magnetococcus massalia]
MISLIAGSLVAGLMAGVVAGMFGVGGGIILVPALLLLFHLQGVSEIIIMQMAVATSMATIILTNLSATWHHHKRGVVQWSTAGRILPGILLGAWAGAWLATMLEGSLLKLMFAIFVMLVGLKMIQAQKDVPADAPTLPQLTQPVFGLLIGVPSSLFGIGGGSLSVPILSLFFATPVRQAVATSSAMGLGLAISATVGFIQAGATLTSAPSWSWGYLAWPALLGISCGTLITTPLGVKLAHGLDPVKLKRGFGIFLLLVGGKLIVG